MHSDYLAMQQAVVDGDVETARRLARSLVESSSDLLPAIEQGFAAGIRQVGDLWEEGVAKPRRPGRAPGRRPRPAEPRSD